MINQITRMDSMEMVWRWYGDGMEIVWRVIIFIQIFWQN